MGLHTAAWRAGACERAFNYTRLAMCGAREAAETMPDRAVCAGISVRGAGRGWRPSHALGDPWTLGVGQPQKAPLKALPSICMHLYYIEQIEHWQRPISTPGYKEQPWVGSLRSRAAALGTSRAAERVPGGWQRSESAALRRNAWIKRVVPSMYMFLLPHRTRWTRYQTPAPEGAALRSEHNGESELVSGEHGRRGDT